MLNDSSLIVIVGSCVVQYDGDPMIEIQRSRLYYMVRRILQLTHKASNTYFFMCSVAELLLSCLTSLTSLTLAQSRSFW